MAFEEAFYKAKEYDVTLYHGAEDNWTSPRKSKIFADETQQQVCRIF